MREKLTYSLPRWRVTRWLVDAGPGIPKDIRAALIGGLFGTMPIFIGGVGNTLLVSALIAARVQTAPFIAWFAFESVICIVRAIVLTMSRRAARAKRKTPTDLYLLLGLAWSLSVGYGVLISLASTDWVIATVACLSAAAMVGGICFRNFSAPRLAAAMILTSLGPCLPGAVLGGEPLLYIVFAQIPMYVVAMTMAAFKLNKMLVLTMRAERESDYRARHDALTGLANRTGLIDAVDRKLVRADASAAGFALLFLDLDGFKSINDRFGHAAGDRMLEMVAERMRRMLRPADIAARIGGDEFLVVAEGLTAEQALDLGRRLIHAVATSYELDNGSSSTIGVSVGIALAPEHGSDFETLSAVADAALYEAKSTGKLRCCMGSPLKASAAAHRRRAKDLHSRQIGAAA